LGDGPASIIGVLALQGDFAAHEAAITRAGAVARAVKKPGDLEDLAALVMPGGESTTLLKHFDRYGFEEPIRRFGARGGAFFGTCAGAILMAREARSPVQASLGLADIAVERNAYGRQCESFQASLEVPALGARPFEAIFIRAPRIVSAGPGVEILATLDGSPVLVREGRMLVATFHPELTPDARIHAYFLAMVRGISAAPTPPFPTRGAP
jgi:pyridoxal 5'-phosphate synthase pdxT subunit